MGPHDIWLNWHEVANHAGRCFCHPVRHGCCDRWPPDGILVPGAFDGIDTTGFCWHIVLPCSPAVTVMMRAASGGPPRFIGDAQWKRDEL